MSDSHPPSTPLEPSSRKSWLRRLYDWTLSWAERPGGATALFLVSFAESSFFPIPPDVLLVALCVGARSKAFRFALICSIGSVLGGIAGYAIGHWGYEWIGKAIVHAYHGESVMEKINHWYETYGFMGTLLAAITPIPYKIFTIASGVFSYPFGSFVLASVIGRSFRFFVVATLLYYYGPPIKSWMEKYFDRCAWAFLILLVLGFVALKWL